MLEEVLRSINNFFEVAYLNGTYTVTDGSIELPTALSGQYFLIKGSIFNDGLHQYPCTDLTDETFTGCIHLLAVPKTVQTLADDIEAWQAANGETASSTAGGGTYVSESFGGYSYTKATDAVTGAAATWQSVFARRLNAWRKI